MTVESRLKMTLPEYRQRLHLYYFLYICGHIMCIALLSTEFPKYILAIVWFIYGTAVGVDLGNCHKYLVNLNLLKSNYLYIPNDVDKVTYYADLLQSINSTPDVIETRSLLQDYIAHRSERLPNGKTIQEWTTDPEIWDMRNAIYEISKEEDPEKQIEMMSELIKL